MADVVSSISGNLHIVRRLVAGFVVIAFAAFAHIEVSDTATQEAYKELINSNATLFATVFLLTAYLVGSLAEFAGNSILLYFSSVLAETFGYPLKHFAWLPIPYRIVSILFWWIIGGYVVAPYLFIRRLFGVPGYKIPLEKHLDRDGAELFASLGPSVRFGWHAAVRIYI